MINNDITTKHIASAASKVKAFNQFDFWWTGKRFELKISVAKPPQAICKTLYAMRKKEPTHKQHIWFLPTLD